MRREKIHLLSFLWKRRNTNNPRSFQTSFLFFGIEVEKKKTLREPDEKEWEKGDNNKRIQKGSKNTNNGVVKELFAFVHNFNGEI